MCLCGGVPLGGGAFRKGGLFLEDSGRRRHQSVFWHAMVGHLAKDHNADQSFSRVQYAAVTAWEAAQCICDLWLPTEEPGQQISTPSSIRLRPCGHAVSQGGTICLPSRQEPKLWWNSGHVTISPRLE